MRVLHMLNQRELAKAAMYGTSVIVVSNLAENDSMRCPGFERVQGNFWLFMTRLTVARVNSISMELRSPPQSNIVEQSPPHRHTHHAHC